MNTDILQKKIKGTMVLPTDNAYGEACAIYNGMIAKKPALIVKCKEVTDVVHAVNFAREHQLEVAIKSGGHNGAGLALVDDGLVIDLSEMNGIEVNPKSGTAVIQPGATLSEIDQVTHEHGWTLPSGIIGTTGIGGLTLGGGLGYLSRKAGLTIDHLVEAQVVLATGEQLIVNDDHHADLFWALRGGGGNFGVVVSFTFRLARIKNVYGGPMFWPLEKAHEAMRFYETTLAKASNDLYGFFAFLTVPPGDPFPQHLHMQKVCGVVWCYTGPMEQATEVFAPIRDFGPPILDFVGEIPMPALNGMFDPIYPPGLQWYWKSHYINELTDECIAENIKHASNMPSMHSTMHMYPIDGKVHEVGQEDTAWAHRGVRWSQVIVGVDLDPANADTITQWCRDYYDGIQPYAAGGAYVNFMMEEGPDRIKAGYKDNYERLVQVKKKYDPQNFFHINQNIKPV